MTNMEALATIDFGMFIISKLFGDISGRTSLDLLIDRATGKEKYIVEYIIEVFTDIKQAKEVLNYNSEIETSMIERLKKLL